MVGVQLVIKCLVCYGTCCSLQCSQEPNISPCPVPCNYGLHLHTTTPVQDPFYEHSINSHLHSQLLTVHLAWQFGTPAHHQPICHYCY